jgi:hypothetical protein
VTDIPSPDDNLSLTLAAWILAIIGWSGLAMLIVYFNPRLGPLPIWSFFLLWLMALTGTAVPFVRYLNRRFAREAAPANVILRQALWVGVFGATCAWLELDANNLLNSVTVALVLIALIGIEVFLRLRERAHWAPESPDDESA